MYVIFFNGKFGGYFLRCDEPGMEDNPYLFGGTLILDEATKFQTISQARSLGKKYLEVAGKAPGSRVELLKPMKARS